MTLKKNEPTKYEVNFHIKQNDTRDIDLNIGRDISDKDHSTISTIVKNIESGYYLVKWTSGIYTLQLSYKLGKYVIKDDELVRDEVYLNPLRNFKQCYTPYEKNKEKQ